MYGVQCLAIIHDPLNEAMSSSTLTEQTLARRKAALRFLVGRIDYERMLAMPCSEETMKLGRMRELLHRLGNPQEGMPILHVAGTKGKGSTAAMLASLLSAAGYRTGLFSSPHLDHVEERMVINGLCCSDEELADLVELIRPEVETLDRGAARNGSAEHGPTYFEIITAMALCHFARCRVGAAVLEVGLGGRLDSTNVCTPRVSIITSISLDHTKQLGETLAAIAAEKAGIIKPGVPVVSGVTAEEPRAVIRRIAHEKGCRLVELGRDFDFDDHPPLHLERAPAPAHFDFRYAPRDTEQLSRDSRGLTAPGLFHFKNVALGLLGRHQAANAAVALAAVEELRHTGWTIPEDSIRRGLADVVWPARVEIVARRPAVVLDAAHNAASVESLVEVLVESFSAKRRFLVFATTLDKDLRGMLRPLLDHFDHVIFTRYASNPRGVPPEQLQALAAELQAAASVEIASTPVDAWDVVARLAEPDDLICVTGSFFLAAELRRQIVARPLSR